MALTYYFLSNSNLAPFKKTYQNISIVIDMFIWLYAITCLSRTISLSIALLFLGCLILASSSLLSTASVIVSPIGFYFIFLLHLTNSDGESIRSMLWIFPMTLVFTMITSVLLGNWFSRTILLPDLIVSEKKLQYKHLPITIGFTVAIDSYGVFAQLVVSDFKRMISNLIKNAVEAINGKGEIRINLSTSGSSVNIEISDSGIGMPPELIAKVFDGSIISNKKESSGIGLVSAYKLIKS